MKPHLVWEAEPRSPVQARGRLSPVRVAELRDAGRLAQSGILELPPRLLRFSRRRVLTRLLRRLLLWVVLPALSYLAGAGFVGLVLLIKRALEGS